MNTAIIAAARVASAPPIAVAVALARFEDGCTGSERVLCAAGGSSNAFPSGAARRNRTAPRGPVDAKYRIEILAPTASVSSGKVLGLKY